MIPFYRMQLEGGMLARAIPLKIWLMLVLILVPFLLSGLTFSQAVQMNDDFRGQHVSSDTSTLMAGNFQYFDIVLNVDVEKIYIVAYQIGRAHV